DETGNTLLATGSDLRDESGSVTGQQVRFPSNAGQAFRVRVLRSDADTSGTDSVRYSLGLQSLTADLGTRVFADVSGTLTPGGQALYRVTAAAAGSIRVQLSNDANVQGDLNLQIVDPDTFAVLSHLPPPASAPSVEPNDSIGQGNLTGLVGSGPAKS